MKIESQENPVHPPHLTMAQPATYRIEVLGHLDSSWSDRLAGMKITTTGGSGIVPRTIMQGQLLDQSALAGVLNTLCDLGLPLIDAAYLPSGDNNK